VTRVDGPIDPLKVGSSAILPFIYPAGHFARNEHRATCRRGGGSYDGAAIH
jgi:hypothetical protein